MKKLVKVAVTGGSGMLGTSLLNRLSLNYDLYPCGRSSSYVAKKLEWQFFDLLEYKKLIDWLMDIQPDVVIHCAALVDVDGCEQVPQVAKQLHVDVTKIIVNTIKQWNGYLIYISTDSVFDGNYKGFYHEGMLANPQNTYSKTKFEGELSVLSYVNGLVLRTNIFGWTRSNRTSFAEWLIKGLFEQQKLTMFTDVFYTPIHIDHASDIISKILDNPKQGLFHLAGNTSLSKYEFAIAVANEFHCNTDYIVATSIEAAKLKAFRPRNMSLSNKNLSGSLNIPFPDVTDGINLLKEQYISGWSIKVKSA